MYTAATRHARQPPVYTDPHTVCDTVISHLATDEALLRARVADLERDVLTYRGIATEAFHALHRLTKRLRGVRDENIYLRAQIRACVSGRSIAEEREALDAEPHPDDEDGGVSSHTTRAA